MNHKITFLLSFLLPSLLIADITEDVVHSVDPIVKLGQELGWISIIPFISWSNLTNIINNINCLF